MIGNTMARKLPELAGKPLEGALAEPIDILKLGLPAWAAPPDEIENYRELKGRELFDARRAKIPDLARHLGLDPDSDGFRGAGGREFLLELTLMALARATVIGFQEKKEGKWEASFVFWTMHLADRHKAQGKFDNDYDFCVAYLAAETPELAKRTKKTELHAAALQLRNRISEARSTFEKAKKLAERDFHKNAAIGIVKH
jgi:hypothetical protein